MIAEALFLLLYLLPGLIAVNRKHHNAAAILALDILLGWTFLGWVISFVWACTATRNEYQPRYYVQLQVDDRREPRQLDECKAQQPKLPAPQRNYYLERAEQRRQEELARKLENFRMD